MKIPVIYKSYCRSNKPERNRFGTIFLNPIQLRNQAQTKPEPGNLEGDLNSLLDNLAQLEDTI